MKKVVSIIAVIVMLAFSIQVMAAGNNINFEKAKWDLLENSSTLKKLRYATYKAKDQYEGAVETSDNTSVESMRELYTMLGWEFDKYTEMQIIKQRDFVPKQTKYYWEISQTNEAVTQNNLVIGLRSVFLALLNSEMDCKIKEQRLVLEGKKASQNNKKYELGLISELDLEESRYNLLKAQKELEAVKRIRENSCRTFNKYIGAPVDTSYDNIVYRETYSAELPMPIEQYIEKGIKERAEIVNAQKEIELKQFEKKILEKDDVGQIYRHARKDYSTLLNDLESLKIRIEKSKLDIESEMKRAYIEIKKDSNTIKNLKSTIETRKRSLEHMKVLLGKGMATETSVEEMQIAINELENSCKLAVYNCNTKIIRLENAAGLGPAY